MTLSASDPVPFDRRAIPAQAVEAHWHAQDGHAIRRIDWPVPQGAPRGSLLFLPGRGDYYEKYLETLDLWHRQGWSVTATDWRGQARSGRFGFDSDTGHVEDFSVWIDDLADLWEQWRGEGPGPHVLVAHSMGGHIALRALAERRINPAAVVLVAPMLVLSPGWLPLPVQHAIARAMTAIGDPRRPAWDGVERPRQFPSKRARLLTHDRARYEDVTFWRDERPGLGMGAPSWGWIERAIASARLIESRGFLERISEPVLMLSALHDRLVASSAIARAARRIPHGEIVEFGRESRHEILRETDDVRDRALRAIDEFLDRTAPVHG